MKNNKKDDRIRPCPFCGSDDVSMDITIDSGWGSKKYKCFEVYCEPCDYAGPCDSSEDGALARWNTRRG